MIGATECKQRRTSKRKQAAFNSNSNNNKSRNKNTTTTTITTATEAKMIEKTTKHTGALRVDPHSTRWKMRYYTFDLFIDERMTIRSQLHCLQVAEAHSIKKHKRKMLCSTIFLSLICVHTFVEPRPLRNVNTQYRKLAAYWSAWQALNKGQARKYGKCSVRCAYGNCFTARNWRCVFDRPIIYFFTK